MMRADQLALTEASRAPEFQSVIRLAFRFFAVLLGLGLLGSLVFWTGPQVVWKQAQVVGRGFPLIIILGGLSQLIRTCAWRQTITYDIKGLRWSRSIGAQLASDACGQLGFAGKMVGEGLRVSLLSPVVPVARGISSCAIEGGMHLLTAAVVAVLGIIVTVLHFPLSGQWQRYALVLAGVLIAVVALAFVAVASRWQLMRNTARAIARLPHLHNWIMGKEPTIDSAENNLLVFSRKAPRAFWTSLILSLLWHLVAVLEVYVTLRFMGAGIALVGTFALEGLTKVINLVGALNPGNVGTYEAGNMLIAKMFGVTATAGLTLALCRRARGLFWAGVGAVCMLMMKRAEWGKAESRYAP
jgi:Lysylphosphatidylglycerol synthase TM region